MKPSFGCSSFVVPLLPSASLASLASLSPLVRNQQGCRPLRQSKITRNRCSASPHWQQQQQQQKQEQNQQSRSSSPAVFAEVIRSTRIVSNNCSGSSTPPVAKSFRRDDNHRIHHQFQTSTLFKTGIVGTAAAGSSLSSSSFSFPEQCYPRHAASLPVRVHGNSSSFFPDGLRQVQNCHHRSNHHTYNREEKSQRRCFSSYNAGGSSSSSSSIGSRRNKRSPYAVLGLRKNNNKGRTAKNTNANANASPIAITKDTIKAAFRNLAKVYHPDINPDNRPREECEALMSELVEAYERLLKHANGGDDDDSDFLDNIRVGTSNKVALACELYSVDELSMDRFHEVHALQMVYIDADDDVDNCDCDDDDDEIDSKIESGWTLDDEKDGDSAKEQPTSLPVSATATHSILPIPFKAHPGDSVSDLKGRLESSSEFGIQSWGLTDCLGWELVALTRRRNRDDSSISSSSSAKQINGDDNEDEDPSILAANNEVLSYHLFLDDYHVRHGDIIYAVVRKHDD